MTSTTDQRRTLRILNTKLYRPPVTADLVVREELLARLEAGRRLPLTLVSAPAGYGKTTLTSHWLETCAAAGAWLSLDETESDLRGFLGYFVAAVKTLFPKACRTLSALLEADELPPTPYLADCLSNDLDTVGEPIVLALDDYHCLGESAVHELVDHLLAHPPRGLHLVVLSRRDPPLALTALRAQHRMTEIRLRDLRFTARETASFLEQAVGRPVGGPVGPLLHENTEGWPVALRLAALALQHEGNVDELTRGMTGDSWQVQEYLVAEVLSHQTPEVREWLDKTSILDRFCAPLSEAVCRPPREGSRAKTRSGDGAALSGRQFIRRLEAEDLFCIALDDRREWHRYHHLFQEILRRRCEARTSPGERAALHRRASAWLAENGYVEVAIRHALAGRDAATAARLVAEHGSEALNQEQWPELARWLAMLPAAIVKEDPQLLLLRAFSLDYRYQFEEAWSAVDKAEALLSVRPSETAPDRRLRGEIEALRGEQHYMAAEGERGVACAERAMARLPPEAGSARGFAICILAASMQMEGDLAGARSVLYRALEGNAQGTFHTRVLVTLCIIESVAGDLAALGQTARRALRLADELELEESRGFGRYFLGIFHYQRNELGEAQRYLEPLVAEPFLTRKTFYTHGAFALALAREARGRGREARDLGEAVVAHLLEIESVYVLPMARAFLAELDLRQGHPGRAAHWADTSQAGPLLPMYMFYVPQLTQAKAWIARGEPGSLQRAAALLTRLHDYVARTHNQRFLIEILALQALLHDAEQDEPAALAALAKAVDLAHPAGFIRLFVDLGPGLARLLHRLDLEGDALRHAGELLAAFHDEDSESPPPTSSAPQPLLEPLTQRELEILGLLAEGLENKKIADRLFISPSTVKRHASNIYGKLRVHGRWRAVAKAAGLGILASD